MGNLNVSIFVFFLICNNQLLLSFKMKSVFIQCFLLCVYFVQILKKTFQPIHYENQQDSAVCQFLLFFFFFLKKGIPILYFSRLLLLEDLFFPKNQLLHVWLSVAVAVLLGSPKHRNFLGL